jgi:lysophospholipid hydrolase
MAGLAPSLTLGLSTSYPATTSSLPSPLFPPAPATMAGWIGWLFTFVFHTIPSVLYWVITFTTITLPTWLFTLFSMSLTFTMNFTTLYVYTRLDPLSLEADLET